ncbi:uncharacterized protein [Lepeophtheirus salmonis]|uniref:uncharacterized protein n=1 Tax=Lepeophtheirus salmonis TaxID=72036 RepID=UPI003AF34480
MIKEIMLQRILLLILGSLSVVHTIIDEDAREIPLLLSPMDGEGKSLPRKGDWQLQDDNHDNFKNVDEVYLGVESIKVLPSPKNLESHIGEGGPQSKGLPEEINEQINAIKDPLVFSDFFPFPPSDFHIKIEKMKEDFGDIHLNSKSVIKNPSPRSGVNKYKNSRVTLNTTQSYSSNAIIPISPRPFYPSWPIQDEPTRYEKGNKAITELGKPRSTSLSDFNAILFMKTKSPITIVEAPNLAVIGQTVPRYRAPQHQQYQYPRHSKNKSKVKKNPRKRFRLFRSRYPTRRNNFFAAEGIFSRAFNRRRNPRHIFLPVNGNFG